MKMSLHAESPNSAVMLKYHAQFFSKLKKPGGPVVSLFFVKNCNNNNNNNNNNNTTLLYLYLNKLQLK